MPIETHLEFRDWLKTQSREVRILIAARAALRVFPIVTHDERADKTLALLTARAILISGVVAKMPTPDATAHAAPAARAAHAARAAADPADSTALATAHAVYAAGHAARAAADPADSTALASTDATAHASHATAYAGRAADATVHASHAAHPAAFADSDVALAAAYADSDNGFDFDALLSQPVWHKPGEPDWLQDALAGQDDLLDSGPEWAFWRDWYQGFRDGKHLGWALQYRVALIDDEIWKAGPEAVAREIERIQEDLAKKSSKAKPVTDTEKSMIQQRVASNRDALAISTAALQEQLAAFNEQVRGVNHLDPDLRSELLEFIDGFSATLDEMRANLPQPGEELSEAKAESLVLWLRQYKSLMRAKLARYASPENMTEVTLPTGIVLGATAIGAMLGNPLAGSVVGGLIANQMKPGQAARELMKPDKPGEGSNI